VAGPPSYCMISILEGREYIVNVQEAVSDGCWDGNVLYVASKGAMLGLTKLLTQELASPAIKVQPANDSPCSDEESV
jgi:NAD(P)-dependent dehydrogenase (short-subunit alcohol dehydrogenase family)